MSHDVPKLRRTERSPRPIVHLKSGDTRISLRRIRSNFRNCEGLKSLCVRQSLFISATTTPNKSLVAQRNVRSLNLVIHTVSEQVSSSLDLVSLSLFFVGSRIPRRCSSVSSSLDLVSHVVATNKCHHTFPDGRLFTVLPLARLPPMSFP